MKKATHIHTQRAKSLCCIRAAFPCSMIEAVCSRKTPLHLQSGLGKCFSLCSLLVCLSHILPSMQWERMKKREKRWLSSTPGGWPPA
ncbi:Protein ACCELERATED CELL DEATH 6 [Clarias magur]|uniref:Protein ACCELERATED CELL DEATH 6 n=1 Tax=Clarias magur TaxID=1594786 RepID=A0A8J4XCE0_CLAMG|nr:Protein ACCELERATED CELL DEATH 6 [Clarias magur]